MGMKFGLLVTAIGIGIAIRAHRKKQQQQQHAITNGNAGSSHFGGMLPAAAVAGAGALGMAAYSHHNNSSSSNNMQASSGSLRDPAAIYQHLVKCVLDKNLQPFYPPNGNNGVYASVTPNLHQLASQIASSGALERIAHQYQLPDAFAMDLVKLALFDIVILVDDSGSMQAGNRLNEMRQIVSEVAHIAAAFDSNGIEIRFMNANSQGNNVRTDADVANIMRVPPNGRTPAGQSLRDKILMPLVVNRARQNQLPKPVLVMVATDGAATDHQQDSLPVVISRAKDDLRQTSRGENSVFFSICQVGDDRDAVDFLEALDNDPRIGMYIDVTSSPEIETRQIMKGFDKNVKGAPPQWRDIKDQLKNDPHLWTTLFRLKRLLGPIDPYYDQTDESGQKKRSSWFGASEEPTYKQHWSEQPGFVANQSAMQAQRGYQYTGPMSQAGPPVVQDNAYAYGQSLPQQAQPQPPPQQSYGSGYGNQPPANVGGYGPPPPLNGPQTSQYGQTYGDPNYSSNNYGTSNYNNNNFNNNYNNPSGGFPNTDSYPPPGGFQNNVFGQQPPLNQAYNQPYDNGQYNNQYNNQPNQPYGNQSYGNPPYGNQPYGNPAGGFAFPQP